MTRLIDADSLNEEINKIVDEEIKVDEKWATGLRYSLKLIDNAPEVKQEISDPCDEYDFYIRGYNQARKIFERPQGNWLFKIHPDISHSLCLYGKCSQCKNIVPIGEFCINCGAYMHETTTAEAEVDNI